jgi:CO/xanthine dehydrogenase FAD-binding subunit
MTGLLETGYEGGKKSLALDIKDSMQILYEHPACPELLRGVLSQMASWQERNETTLGIALRWSADFCATLLVMGTRVNTNKNNTQQTRDELLADFLDRRGIIASLVELHLPLDVPGRVFGHAQVRRTPGDIPIVSAYAAVDLVEGRVKAARLALTGVWQEHTQLAESAAHLISHPLNDETISATAKAVAKGTNPKDNYLGSAKYRREMAEVLTRRALTMCREVTR